MADADPAIQECATCGTLIDVTDEQPLALRHCPNCGAAMRVRRIFNHFELQEVLGAGGMGAVYRALDTKLNRAVALKLLRFEHSQNAEFIESFAKEAAITASINHPHVVRVYSTGTDHGIFYIAMELVDKGSLDDLMALQGRIGESQVLDVGIQIAEGLRAAQQRGLIHRDVKPGNILFADAHNAKIVDFGLAVLQEHANVAGGAVWGTPYYVAPEKLDPQPHEDFRSDMYSLGATLFHAAAGRPPFESDTESIVKLKHLKMKLVSLQAFAPEVSSATAYVINKMLQRDPEKRFASYDEVIENLQYARNELLGAADSRQKHPGPRHGASHPWLTVLSACVTVAAGLALYRYDDRMHPKPSAPATPVPQMAAAAFDTAYAAAREQIVAGKYAEAAAAFRALDEREVAPQPLRNWVNMNAALALLLAGEADEAKKEFRKVEARGIYSPDPTEQKNAAFFVTTAQLAAGDEVRTAEVARDYDRTNHECFALLLLAIKDWGLGAFDEAGKLFEEFQAAKIDERDAWLNALKPIAATHLADLQTYRALADAARSSSQDIAVLTKAVETAKEAHEKQKQPGKFTEGIAELETTLGKQLASAQEARAMKESEQDAAESKALSEALVRVNEAFTAFQFSEAARALAAVPLQGEKRKAERDAWAKRSEWLAGFKASLISDINTVHYPRPLRRKNGTEIPLGLGKAGDTLAEMVTPYGSVPVPWSDLSVESVVALAQAFLRTAPLAASADRQWQLGVFLHIFGKRSDAIPLLRQAAEARPDYQPFLALFPET